MKIEMVATANGNNEQSRNLLTTDSRNSGAISVGGALSMSKNMMRDMQSMTSSGKFY